MKIDNGIYHAVPPGKKTGCLPRVSHPGEWFPLAEDRIELVPQDQWKVLSRTNKVTPFVPMILDQDGVGSCATEATAQALMTCARVSGLPHVPLNPWFVYHHTSGGRDAGSSIDENLRFIQEHGCSPMEVWPRSEGWKKKPSQEAYEAAKHFQAVEVFDIQTIEEFVSAVLRGFIVVYGARGHAVCGTEYRPEGPFGPNSWGTTWEQNGMGIWVSWGQVNWRYGAWALRVISERSLQ